MNVRHLTTKTSVPLLLISVCLNIYLLLDTLGPTGRYEQRGAIQQSKGVADDRKTSFVLNTEPAEGMYKLQVASENRVKRLAESFKLQQNNKSMLSENGVRSSHETRYMLAVAIMSSPGNIDTRNAIRITWKNGYENRNYFVKFVVGTKGLDQVPVQSLQRENNVHGDMILMDLRDSYKGLAHKVLATLVWFDKNVNYSYILKCDDDTFPMLDQLEDKLFQRDHTRGLYWGYFLPKSPPLKEGRWAETNWKFCDNYFPYAAGGGYILSADVVHRVASNADALIVYNNEDVSVGAWTVSYDIERIHDVKFDTETWSRGCNSSFLVFHKQTIKDILEKDSLYRNSGRMCEREFLLHEFEYDWKELPRHAHKQTCCLEELYYGWAYRITLLCIGILLILTMWKIVLDKHFFRRGE